MLLLDSQALLWLLDDSPRLGPQARQAVKSAQGVHVSGQGLELLSVTAEHAEAIHEFPELIRHDPFDRLIVAQASRAGLQLLTADHVLLDLQRDFILDASR
jgi:PIN domain nuclease of toxin-antitoxin system